MVTAALIFAYSWWLVVLPVLIIISPVLYYLSKSMNARRIRLFVSPGAAKDAMPVLDAKLHALRFIMPAMMVALVALALARPLSGPKAGSAERVGVDFVVALDVSKSMWAEDVAPSRLDAVKKEISSWLKQASGDRMGLVLFAGEAIIQAPITFDYEALDRILENAGPRAISKGGTNIPKAIEMATSLLTKSGLDTRALVIFSDGENLDGDAVAAARTANSLEGLSIFTVGVGTAAGERVPSIDRASFDKLPPERRQARAYIRSEYGTEVVSRLDESALRSVSSAGGGRHETFIPDTNMLQRLRDSALLPLTKSRAILNTQDYHEWFQVPLALAILLVILHPLIPVVRRQELDNIVGVPVIRPETHSAPAITPVKFARKTKKPAPVVLWFLVMSIAVPAWASTEIDQRVASLFQQEKAEEAVALVKAEYEKSPTDPLLNYNYGITLYQAGKLEEALAVFQNLRGSPDAESIQARVLFQLGNAQFRLGEQLRTQPGAILSMERALAYYEELLVVKSSDDAKKNRDAAKKALEDILKNIAESRLKQADDLIKRENHTQVTRVLQEALDAQERLVSLDTKDKQRAKDKTKTQERLAESLKNDAKRASAEADKIEKANDKGKDRQVLGQREDAIAKFERAQMNAPNDTSIPPAIQAERSKMSNLISSRAAAEIKPHLAKAETPRQALEAMSKGSEQLAKALDLDANNKAAADLKKEVDARLEKEFLDQGEKALANALQQTDARKKLRLATNAGDAFQKTQEVNPDNQKAKEGLAKVEAMLPELHAAAAALDLAEAQGLLGQNGQKPQEAKGGQEPAASQDSLKKAIGLLETSTQNFGRSLALKPDQGEVQQGFETAQELLSESRDQLDAQRQAANAAKAEGENEGEGQQAAQAEPTEMQVYNQRPSGQVASPTGGFWNKSKKDW